MQKKYTQFFFYPFLYEWPCEWFPVWGHHGHCLHEHCTRLPGDMMVHFCTVHMYLGEEMLSHVTDKALELHVQTPGFAEWLCYSPCVMQDASIPGCCISTNTEHRVWYSPTGSAGCHCRITDGFQNSSDDRQYVTPSWTVLAQVSSLRSRCCWEPLSKGRTVPSSLMLWLAGSLHWLDHSVLQRTACDTPAGFPRATNLGWEWGGPDGTRRSFVACHHVCHLLLITQASSDTTWRL